MREIDHLIQYWHAATSAGHACALASVVYVEGSSYRKPGARMCVTSQGQVAGAVSGGCVERAVAARAKRVMESGMPEMMVYDGRHRLGCNGSLHILIEPFSPDDSSAFYEAYAKTRGARHRGNFRIESFANGGALFGNSENLAPDQLGSVFSFSGEVFSARSMHRVPNADDGGFAFRQNVKPAPQLYVIGTEYDAIVLAKLSAAQGWDTTLITHPRNPLVPIEGLTVAAVDPAVVLDHLHLDAQTGVVLMSHNYGRDLAYFKSLTAAPSIKYLGLLGPSKRRDQLLNDLADAEVDFPEWIDTNVYGPAGLDLGGELPEQIGLSIMAELVAVFSGRPVPNLRDKRTSIHDPVTA